jgi:hypothetical protein
MKLLLSRKCRSKLFLQAFGIVDQWIDRYCYFMVVLALNRSSNTRFEWKFFDCLLFAPSVELYTFGRSLFALVHGGFDKSE